MPLGIGFQPGVDNTQQGGGQNSGPSPLESVVKLLNLRLPSVVGARGIAPRELLASPGSAALGVSPTSASVEQWLRRLLQGADPFTGISSTMGASNQHTTSGEPTGRVATPRGSFS